MICPTPSPSPGCFAPGVCDPINGRCWYPRLADTETPCSGPLCFTDITAASGLRALPDNTDFQFVGAGAAILDYDGDGRLDIALVKPERPVQLFRGFVDGTWRDRTVAAGLGGLTEFRGSGVAAGDFNNDGHPDLLVTSAEDNRLFQNQGNGAFAEVSHVLGGDEARWSASAALGDFDRDGWLDIYVSNYIETINFPFHDAWPNQLFWNNGDGTFSESSARFGVDGDGTTLASLFSDVNDDGWPDLIVCNDFGDTVEPNRLYLSRGRDVNGIFDGFEEVSQAWGVNLEFYCMTIARGDFDADGDLDMFHTNIGRHVFLRRDAPGPGFTDITDTLEIGLVRDPCQPELFNVGWTANFHDFDSDSWIDIYIAGGHIPSAPEIENSDWIANRILRNVPGDGGTRGFDIHSSDAGLNDTRQSRGAAFGDLDGDGDVDVVQTHTKGGVLLLRNDTAGGHWLQLKLQGRVSARDAVGARARLHLNDGRVLLRELNPYTGYLSSSEHALHFGLGIHRPEHVEIRWLSGISQQLRTRDRDRRLQIIEPLVTLAGATFDPPQPAAGAVALLTLAVDAHADAITDPEVELSLYQGDQQVWPGATVPALILMSGRQELPALPVPIPAGLSGELQLRVTIRDAEGGRDERDYPLMLSAP